MTPLPRSSWWSRFWHEPVRAERLALFRILLGVAMLSDQLFQLLPNLNLFFGPDGVAPTGLHDRWAVQTGRWTVLVFNHDAAAVVYPLFAAWVAVTLLWTLGLFTRLSNVALWLLTMCFGNRNLNIINCGDQTMHIGILLLMMAPCGKALSIDAWLARRRTGTDAGPVFTSAWPLRLIQTQLCIIYFATGMAKLRGEGWGTFRGTWWDGTSVYYVLNSVTIARWSYAQLRVPVWITRALTYASVWWELLFPALVLVRRTRFWALCFGVLFHLGIWITIEVGWFSFYTLAFYGVWVPDSCWERWRGKRTAPTPQRAQRTAA